MQVMPETADLCEIHDPYHAVNNLMGACECLRSLINRYQGNISLALAAYNAARTTSIAIRGFPPSRRRRITSNGCWAFIVD